MSQKLTHEDAFYNNLTLGLMQTLRNIPRVCDVTCEKRSPCDKVQLIAWEQRHCVYLPEDMKKFYLSTNGFNLHWKYRYAPNDIRRVGYIHLPHLIQIILLRENIDLANSIQDLENIFKDGSTNPSVSPKTKVFELNCIKDVAKVCLVYDCNALINPKIYLLELDKLSWVFLADSFSEYLRMAIAHLGLPYWELCFSSVGLPPWTEQLFLLLAPHLLDKSEPRRSREVVLVPETPRYVLDTNIFRSKSKSARNAQKTKTKPTE